MRSKNPFISLIVPVYNEQASIEPFIEAVSPILAKTGCEYEIVFINDGSTDDTGKVLKNTLSSLSNAMVITFSRNFGKEAAITAGIDHANGDVVIPIDIDLQDPPELILAFLDKSLGCL